MTIREAHVEWGRKKNHSVFYSRTRGLFEKAFGPVLDTATSLLSGQDLQRIMIDAPLCYEDKVKVASVMEHVMKYAHERVPNQQHEISWNYNDLLKFSNKNGITELRNCGNTDSRKYGNTNIRNTEMNGKEAEELKKGKTAVLQLDPDSGAIIKQFESIAAAEKAIGTHNIRRAITNNGTAGGFRWLVALEGEIPSADAEGEAAPTVAPQNTGTAVERVEAPAEAGDLEPKPEYTGWTPMPRDLSEYSDQELLEEARRRGWKGSVRFMTSVEL